MSQESGIAVSCGVVCRHGLDPALLWLAAVAPIRPLAWQLAYAAGAALRSKKKRRRRKKKIGILETFILVLVGGNVKMVQLLRKTVGRFLKKLKNMLM